MVLVLLVSIGSGIQDLFVPILDKYKTLPYRGNQRFYPGWDMSGRPIPTSFILPITMDRLRICPLPFTKHHPRDSMASPKGLSSFWKLDKEDDQGEPLVVNLDAFAPGIASLANFHKDRVNIIQIDFDSIRCDHNDADGSGGRRDPRVSSTEGYSARHGVSFKPLHDIPEGSELYLYYGDEWHYRYEQQEQKAGNDNVASCCRIRNIGRLS
jgi:hypothetical protein